MRLRLTIAAILVGCSLLGRVVGGGYHAPPALADHNDFLPALPTAVIKTIQERGYGIYALDSRSDNYPSFSRTLEEVYANQCAETSICYRRALSGEAPDVIHTMPESWVAGMGIAGLAWYTSRPAIIEYNWRLGYASWRTTQGHEVGHIDGQHERYYDRNGQLLCITPIPPSRMSCGTGIWYVTPYDRDILWNIYVPDAPATLYLTDHGNGWATVNWGITRRSGNVGHYSNLNDNATRMSFAWAANLEATPAWVGWITDGFFSKYSDYYRGFDAFWKGCIYVRTENAAVWWVPQLSAPDYWTLVGCW